MQEAIAHIIQKLGMYNKYHLQKNFKGEILDEF